MKKNSFSTHFLDRASVERTDIKWIKAQLRDKSTAIIPIFESKVFCEIETRQQAVFLLFNNFKHSSINNDTFIFLGRVENRSYFAVNILASEQANTLVQQKNAEFTEFRQVAPLLSYRDCALLSLARFMVEWHSRNTYCGKCGSKTTSHEGGNVRICTNESCKENFYPSMDPAVIVLVTSGEKCLLGSQAKWSKGLYSTIAGFVEPGESIEDAVYREVEEETGVRVEHIEYQSSQPWLFPASLMLGFYAKAIDDKIAINKNELDDVRWFTREEIRENLNKDTMKLPMKVSIAYNLIKGWYEKGNAHKLGE